MQKIQILAVSGSLRASSSNTVLLRAAMMLAPANVEINLYQNLADLPYFNPDLDGAVAPSAVADFRRQLQISDAILISSPEYAHGVPGVLKNALDWIVSSGETVNKPVGLINASPRAVHAQASLTEILKTMMADIVPAASITLPLSGKNLNENGILAAPELSGALRESIAALVFAVKNNHLKLANS